MVQRWYAVNRQCVRWQALWVLELLNAADKECRSNNNISSPTGAQREQGRVSYKQWR